MKIREMYCVVILSVLYGVAQSANYQRYDTNGYPTYSTSTTANLYNQFPKTASYASDIASFPEATRDPNYSSGYTTSGPLREYSTYTTPRTNNIFMSGLSTQRYGQTYGQGYGQGTGQGYGQGYGQGTGHEYGQGYGQGIGQGYGQGTSQGYGQGIGQGIGQGYGQEYGQGYSSYELPFMKGNGQYCVNRSPQVGIWVESLMGMWYGVEFIQHLAGDSRVDYVRTCIVLHISEPRDRPSTENQFYHVQHLNSKFRHEYRHLRLLWDEAGQNIEYSLYFKNISAGYWQVFEGQNGTLAALPRYQQFGGTIQVLKAVNDHLVLHFCQEASKGRPAQLYTVLFSREPALMSRWEIESVHAMLQTKKLSVASRRMVCGNGADKPLHSLVTTILLFALTYMVRS